MNTVFITSLRLENIPGLDGVYYETLGRLAGRMLDLTDNLPLDQAISRTLYEVLTEFGKIDLMLENTFSYLLSSISDFYYEIVENNLSLIDAFTRQYLITNILYCTYTDEVIIIGVEAYPIC